MKSRSLALMLLLIVPSAWASNQISEVKFRGTLHDALHEIADKGHLNLVIAGPLEQTADVYLKDIPAEEALQSVATAYHLTLEHRGSVWTVSPQPNAPATAQALPPVPPLPPMPQIARDTAKAVQDALKEAQNAAKAQKDEGQDADDDKSDSDDEDSGSEDEDASSNAPGDVHPHIHINMGHHSHGDHDFVSTGPGHVAQDTSVGDAVAFGGGLTVDGNVEGDAAAMGGDLNVHGHVEGDASAMGGSVHVFPGGAVDGDAVAFGGSVIRDEGGTIGGGTQTFGGGKSAKSIIAEIKKEKDSRGSERSAVLAFFVRFIVLFSLGFLSLIFAPNRMRQIDLELKSDPLRCGLTGLLGSFALMALTVFLCVTLIGIPFALALSLAVCIGIVMGVSALASEIGMRLPFFRGHKTQALVLAVGLLALLLVGEIPVMGFLTWMAISFIALGAIIRTRFGGGRRQGIPERIGTPVGA
jgi:hypothetical protein